MLGIRRGRVNENHGRLRPALSRTADCGSQSGIQTMREHKVHPPATMQAPMRRVCERLGREGITLDTLDALEFYAREGDWQAAGYAPWVRSVEAWEIDPRCEPALRRNLPGARIRIGDSYAMAREPGNSGGFDFIVLDNPQGVFGPQGHWCEHFEALELVPQLLRTPGVVICNVNTAPYDYDQHPAWRARREAFYGIPTTERLEAEFVEGFYRRWWAARGLDTAGFFLEPRHEPMLWYAVMQLIPSGSQASATHP
jgi:hypothetical protein